MKKEVLCIILFCSCLLFSCSDSSGPDGNDDDTTAPDIGTAISFSGTSSTGTTVTWGASTDNVTARENLEYKLVSASAGTSIDSDAEIDDITTTGAGLVMDWTADTVSMSVTGLTAGTTYYFAVMVRDAAGNKALYTPQLVETTTGTGTDTTDPTTGSGITFSGTSRDSTTVNWGAATDNVTAQASLEYKLVSASAGTAIDSETEIDAITTAGAGLVMGWTANTISRSVTGLTPDTTYFFAVMVRDAEGNKAIYTPQSVTTLVSANIIYNLNSAPGSAWTVGSSNCDWQWGTVSTVGPVGSICYGTNIYGNYSDNRSYANNYVQLGPLNFSGYPRASGFRLNFLIYLHLDSSWDFCQLQYSTNGTTFSPVPAQYVSGYTYTDGNEWSPDPTASGHEPQWRNVTVNLGGMGLNGQTTVYFRWALRTDEPSGLSYPGVYIDDINIGY